LGSYLQKQCDAFVLSAMLSANPARLQFVFAIFQEAVCRIRYIIIGTVFLCHYFVKHHEVFLLPMQDTR
jgi:hypothetical protein